MSLAGVSTGTIQLDDFNDGIQAAIWTKTSFFGNNAAVTVVEAGGRVTITPITSAGSNTNGYEAASFYDMTGKHASIEFVQRTAADTNAQCRFGMIEDASNFIAFVIANTSFTMRVTTAGTPSDTTLTYSTTDHRWLRIRESGGNTLFDTSTDGITWTNRRSVANPAFGVNTLKPFFLAGTTGSVASPGTGIFDNFHSNL